MRVIYLIVAHNEATSIDNLLSGLKPLTSKMPGFEAYVIENGSTDGTATTLQRLSKEYSWFHTVSIPEKGMGYAFRQGMKILNQQSLKSDDWVLFTAADLPFGTSDLESFLQTQPNNPEVGLFIGSKSHEQSVIRRNFKRSFASWVFRVLRVAILGMKTKDPQGTLFLKASYLHLVEKLHSPDYFFTTELVYHMEKMSSVLEMPVRLSPEQRASKVNVVKDGIKVVRQIFELKAKDL